MTMPCKKAAEIRVVRVVSASALTQVWHVFSPEQITAVRESVATQQTPNVKLCCQWEITEGCCYFKFDFLNNCISNTMLDLWVFVYTNSIQPKTQAIRRILTTKKLWPVKYVWREKKLAAVPHRNVQSVKHWWQRHSSVQPLNHWMAFTSNFGLHPRDHGSERGRNRAVAPWKRLFLVRPKQPWMCACMCGRVCKHNYYTKPLATIDGRDAWGVLWHDLNNIKARFPEW